MIFLSAMSVPQLDVQKKDAKHKRLCVRSVSSWRRGRDSNPRYAFWAYTHFPGVRLQPLGHLSVRSLDRALGLGGGSVARIPRAFKLGARADTTKIAPP